MCFSATASFSGAAAIGAIGICTLMRRKHQDQWLLALIPFLFAFQQLMEGMNWLELQNHTVHPIPAQLSTYLFLFIAMTWPTMIPLAFLKLEKQSLNKRILSVLLIIGLVFEVLFFYQGYHSWNIPITMEVVHHSIYYSFPVSFTLLLGTLYCAATWIPPFISSLKWAPLFGGLNLIAYLLASYISAVTFVSTWCFFGACISCSIFMIISRDSKRRAHV